MAALLRSRFVPLRRMWTCKILFSTITSKIASNLLNFLIVNRCLWGLVKEEEKPNSHLKFVSSDSYTNEDENADNIDILKINQHLDRCPLLTESSLLRTMDAIQSAQAKNLKQDESKEGERVTPEQSDVGNDCLFVIDRIGEAVETVQESDEISENEEIESSKPSANTDQGIDASNTDTSNKQTLVEPASSKRKDNSKRHFQFTIDVDGVRELGGEVEDMPEHEYASQCQNGTVSEEKRGSNDEETADARKADANQPEIDLTAGQSNETAINVDDRSTGDDHSEEVIVVDDDDSADKLDTFYSRQNCNGASENSYSTDERKKMGLDETDIISVGNSSEDSDYPSDRFQEEPVPELSVTSNSITNPSKPLVKPSFGPTGKTRVRVISVLQGLTSHLRRSSFTNTVECRSRAKVPIINCNTRTGFEGDIAIGGHNGVDTSTYALRQVNRFRR